MPTYEYICDACHHEFEQFQSIKADSLRKCPNCGKLKLHRKISTGGGILFKGGGFYETDYRSKGYQDAAKKDKEASSPKTETKSETPEVPAKADAPKTEKTTPTSTPAKAPDKT